MTRQSFTHYERDQLYRSVERILRWFEQHDPDLARLSLLAIPDGYPAGGAGGGGSPGGHSDPTGSALVARVHVPDVIEEGLAQLRYSIETIDKAGRGDPRVAFALLQAAFIVFGQAQSTARRSLPPDPAQVAKPRGDDEWCTSCARVRDAEGRQAIFEHRTRRRGHRKDLCDWCEGEWLGNGKRRALPDQRLVMAHHAGVRLTDQNRRLVLGLKTDEARARYIDTSTSATG